MAKNKKQQGPSFAQMVAGMKEQTLHDKYHKPSAARPTSDEALEEMAKVASKLSGETRTADTLRSTDLAFSYVVASGNRDDADKLHKELRQSDKCANVNHRHGSDITRHVMSAVMYATLGDKSQANRYLGLATRDQLGYSTFTSTAPKIYSVLKDTFGHLANPAPVKPKEDYKGQPRGLI